MIGETIGHFKIVARLGRGGMGEVYAGEHEGIQTRVAIKVLHAEISSEKEHVERFFNEARIVGKIKHAGIVKISDVGYHDGHAYLIMELLEGHPLSSRIRDRAKLPWQEAAEIGRQIASVLDATHRAGVIHRDLKPDNIFLVPDHELATGERVKILDFGISKLSGTMAGNSPKTVGTMGTPAYMAPEQWADSSQIDWRADAYSLGCVLFEMVCGHPPFECNTIFEACGKHLHSKPPVPRELTPDLPAEFDALVLRLLEKDPANRAVSMGQVARELEAIAAGVDVASLPTKRPSRPASQPSLAEPVIAQPSRRAEPTMTTLGGSAAELQSAAVQRRSPAMIGGIVAGVLVVGLVIVVMTRGRDTPTPPVAPVAAPTPIAPPEPVVVPPAAPPDAMLAAAPVPVPVPVDATPIAIVTPDAAVPEPVKPAAAIVHHTKPRPQPTQPQPTPTPQPRPTPQPQPTPTPTPTPTPQPTSQPTPQPQPQTPPPVGGRI